MDEPCRTVRIIRHNKRITPDQPKIQEWCSVHHKWNCDKTPRGVSSRTENDRSATA